MCWIYNKNEIRKGCENKNKNKNENEIKNEERMWICNLKMKKCCEYVIERLKRGKDVNM